MQIDEVIAREAIRKTINAYNASADRRDAATFNALFSENAVFEFAAYPPLPGFRQEGIEQIRARSAGWSKLPVDDPSLRSASFIRHNLTTCEIELTGLDTARAKTYFVVFTDIGPDHAGTYTDTLVRQGEAWLFAHRQIALDWRSPDSIYPPVKR